MMINEHLCQLVFVRVNQHHLFGQLLEDHDISEELLVTIRFRL
jgi:hypothetical protein